MYVFGTKRVRTIYRRIKFPPKLERPRSLYVGLKKKGFAQSARCLSRLQSQKRHQIPLNSYNWRDTSIKESNSALIMLSLARVQSSQHSAFLGGASLCLIICLSFFWAHQVHGGSKARDSSACTSKVRAFCFASEPNLALSRCGQIGSLWILISYGWRPALEKSIRDEQLFSAASLS